MITLTILAWFPVTNGLTTEQVRRNVRWALKWIWGSERVHRFPLLLLLHVPVEVVVILETHSVEEDAEQLTKVDIIWKFLISKTSAVIQVPGKLGSLTLV